MLGFISIFISLLDVYAQKIEPTRTLRESVEEMGKLTVSSEPPGLNVILDGVSLGNTPVIKKEVKSGNHILHLEDAEKEVFILPGKSLLLTYYKGAFIEVLEREESPDKKLTTKDGIIVEETEAEKQPREKKIYKPPSSIYWPENPTGTIYPVEKK
jgi:hypothetical protein